MALRKATAVSNAPPDAEAARVKKMMASRPTLNPNQRRAPRQDLSGAINGVLTGRGGNPQALGAAAMRRLSARQPPPPAPPDAAGAAPAAPPPEFADKVGRMAQPMEMPSGAPPGFESLTPEQKMAMVTTPSRATEVLQAGGPPGAAPAGMAAGLEGALAGGGGGGLNIEGMRQGLPGALRGGGQGGPQQPFASGLPPAIMQRLNALRGAQPQGAPGRAPQMRSSFADFWARNGGGAATPY